eukprot:TRINITY_DN5330_c3_g1_i1.p2 TRINITY_DN5330_c3_g1~~TRINITY_DN5330_c3_g1_i1.p2  ORF type:complete len:110 (-),score=32.13 TRINITY_DN5330_c3_g1_i1:2-331(-)
MHKSGTAFLLPSPDDHGFCWYVNYLASVTRFIPASLQLLADFTAFCASQERLSEFVGALRASQAPPPEPAARPVVAEDAASSSAAASVRVRAVLLAHCQTSFIANSLIL